MGCRAYTVVALLSLTGALLHAQGAPAAAAREKDHEELRGMLRAVTQALNTRELNSLAPLLDEAVSFTTVDQKLLKSLEELKAYFAHLYDRPDAKLQRIEFKPDADELTRFLGPDVGVSHGVSEDRYLMLNGDVRTMSSRWSATVRRKDGRWRLSSLHIGASILDNPLLDAAKRTAALASGGAFLAGLLGGLLGARLWRGALPQGGA